MPKTHQLLPPLEDQHGMLYAITICSTKNWALAPKSTLELIFPIHTHSQQTVPYVQQPLAHLITLQPLDTIITPKCTIAQLHHEQVTMEEREQSSAKGQQIII